MEPFSFEQLPEVVRQIFEKVEKIEVLILELQPQGGEQSKMLNVHEAAAFLNMTVAALYTLVSRKDIPVNKPGKRLYFDKDELNAWIRNGKKKTMATIEQEATTYGSVHRRNFKR